MKNAEKSKKNEEIVDAKDGELVPAAETSVSAEVRVQGVRMDFPFARIGQGMSQWRTPETRNGKPEEGAWYVGKTKDQNYKIGESGKDGGLYGIILDVVYGYKEERPYNPGNTTPPRRWIVAGTNPDGGRVTEADALEAAAKEGFSLALRETGEVWPDTGRPKMRANLSKFCYLMMLVPVPDTFTSDEFRVYPIGDKLYTTVRYEFDKQYFKQFDSIMANIKSRAEFANRGNKDYKFSVNGMVGHLYTFETTNKGGIQYTSHAFEKALRDGKPWEFTADEKADFAKFLMAASESAASVDSAEGDSEF
ncbi:MAG: hypothetical protein HUJ63_00190 [Enterococcus sp.]|nr:hypothetical protein [Enterococcus sp.]